MQKCPFTVEYIMLYLIYYVYNRLLIGGISMTRKKINKLSIILLLSMLLLPFFDLPHVDKTPSHEHNIVLLDDIPEIIVYPK